MTTACIAYWNGVEDIRDNDNVMSLAECQAMLDNFFLPLDTVIELGGLDYTHYQQNKGVVEYFRLSVVSE